MTTTDKLSIYKGQDKTYLLTVYDEDEEPFDLTGATIYFAVKEKETDTVYVISKTTAIITEIEILDQTEAATKGKAKIYVVPADTANIVAKQYFVDVWVRLVDTKRYPVIPVRPYEVKQPIRTTF